MKSSAYVGHDRRYNWYDCFTPDDCFTLLKLGAEEVYTVRVLLVYDGVLNFTGMKGIYLQIIISPLPPAPYTGFTLSICLSLFCPSVCGQNHVCYLYLQQYSSDPFYICTSYQAASESVSHVKCVSKLKKKRNFGKFFKFATLTLSSFDLGSNMTQ